MSTRAMLGAILRRLGCDPIYTATDGIEAILKCMEVNPDIVLMDIDMPGKDGFEALASIQASSPQTFVAMVSAHGTIDYVKRSMELGANGFIVKPYNIAKVSDVLEKFRRDRRKAS